MKAQDFLLWIEKTGISRAGDFATSIGVGRNQAQAYYAAAREGQDVEIKRPVALAMSAIAQGLKPWDEYERGLK